MIRFFWEKSLPANSRLRSLIQTDTNKTQNWYFGLNTQRTHIPGLSHIKYHHFVATKHYVLTSSFNLARAAFASSKLSVIRSELIDGFHAGPRLVQFKAHLGDTSGVEEERRVLSGRVNLVVVLEFCERQKPHQIILSLVGEESEILFQFLVDLYCLSISLWVVGSGG